MNSTDKNNFLWDNSAQPDELEAKLMAELAAFRDQPKLQLEKPTAATRWPLVVGATIAIAAVVVAAILLGQTEDGGDNIACTQAAGGWAVRSEGMVRCEGVPVESASKLPVGRWFETYSNGTASLEVASIGTLEVSANSRLRIVSTEPAHHLLELERGTVHATITAPPRVFVVHTPNVTAIDLGCEYDLEVAEDGTGHLSVESGYVALQSKDGHEAYVPAGVRARILAKGPGTPYADTSTAELRLAIDIYDADRSEKNAAAIVALAQEDDMWTLWDLLMQTDAGNRDAVAAKLIELIPAGTIDEDRIVDLDKAALDAYRSVLEDRWFDPSATNE